MMNTVGYHSNGRNFPSSNNVIDVVGDDEILQFPVNNANAGENANLAKCHKCLISISLGLENKANPSSEPLDHKPKPWKAEHFPMSSIQIGDYMVIYGLYTYELLLINVYILIEFNLIMRTCVYINVRRLGGYTKHTWWESVSMARKNWHGKF